MSLAETERRRAQLLEAAAGISALIMEGLANRIAEAEQRGDIAALARLQRTAAASIGGATRFIAADLARLPPPPLVIGPGHPLYDAAKAACAERGRQVLRGLAPEPPDPGFML